MPPLRRRPRLQGFPVACARAARSAASTLAFADTADGPAFFVMSFVGIVVVGPRSLDRVHLRAADLAAHPRSRSLLTGSQPRPRAAAEGDDRRPAVPSQGRGRTLREVIAVSVSRPPAWRSLLAPEPRDPRCACDPDRARHLAARAQGLEGGPDRPDPSPRLWRAGRHRSATGLGPPGGQDDEFRHVRMTGTFLHEFETPVHGLAPEPGRRPQGYYPVHPLRLPTAAS